MKPLSRINALITFGVLIMLDPFSGLPIAMRTLLQIAFGAAVLGIALSMRAEELRNQHPAPESPPPSEPPPGMSAI